MAAAVPLPPMDMGAPPDRGGAPPSAADMIGPTPSPMPPQQDQNKAFVARVKELHTSLDDLARSFPAFAKYAQQAQDALKTGMVEVMSKMQQPQQGSAMVG